MSQQRINVGSDDAVASNGSRLPDATARHAIGPQTADLVADDKLLVLRDRCIQVREFLAFDRLVARRQYR